MFSSSLCRDELTEIRKFLIENNVPCADKHSILDSLKWVFTVLKAGEERESFITEEFGIWAIHNKAGQILVDCDKEQALRGVEKHGY
jgi:hypothetical protein